MTHDHEDSKPDLADQLDVRRLEALATKTKQLQAELAQARLTRWGLTAGLLALVMGTTLAFINLGRQVKRPENVERILEAATARWETRSPEYARELQEIVRRNSPALTAALVSQFKADMPKFVEAATQERAAFTDSFARGLEERVREHYRELLLRHRDLLFEELPSVEDEKLHDAILANLTVAVDELIERHFVKDLERTMDEMTTNWDEFPLAEAPKKGDPSVQDELLGAMAELIALRIAKTDPAGTTSN